VVDARHRARLAWRFSLASDSTAEIAERRRGMRDLGVSPRPLRFIAYDRAWFPSFVVEFFDRKIFVVEFFDRKITDRKIVMCGHLENLPVPQFSCPLFSLQP
jgi:hypothetical protein